MKKKTFLMLLALVLVLGITVGATLAFLTARTEEVTNTFVAGNITLEISETFNTDSDKDGTNDKWVGHVVPGATEAKDPTLTVKSGSEKCYLYALVDNQLGADATLNVNAEDWSEVNTSGTKTLYRYKDIIDAASANVAKTVFTTVKYGDTITEETIEAVAAKTIVVSGYAHQSDNTDKDTADAAAKTWAGMSD